MDEWISYFMDGVECSLCEEISFTSLCSCSMLSCAIYKCCCDTVEVGAYV